MNDKNKLKKMVKDQLITKARKEGRRNEERPNLVEVSTDGDNTVFTFEEDDKHKLQDIFCCDMVKECHHEYFPGPYSVDDVGITYMVEKLEDGGRKVIDRTYPPEKVNALIQSNKITFRRSVTVVTN